MTDTAVIIVTYQSAGVIGACLDALVSTGAEVIVIDNASNDGTADIVRTYPGVKLIANQENKGFAGGVNQGVAASQRSLLLLLNPDAVFQGGLEQLAAAAREFGGATGRLLNAEGEFQRGFSVRRIPTAVALSCEVLGINRLLPGNPINYRYRCLDLDGLQPAFVEQPAGALLMFRRDVWERLEGLDERFHPAWFEDVDFCQRLLEAGYRIRFLPEVSARHQGGHSANQLAWADKEMYWYGSLLEYASKHYSRLSLALVSLSVVVGALLRCGMGIFIHRSLKPVKTYANVMRLACAYLIHGRNGGVKKSSQSYKDQARIHGF